MNIYNFSHFIQIWLFPPGVILILLFFGILVLQKNNMLDHVAKGKWIIITAFVLLWFFSMPMMVQTLIDPLQRQYHPLSELNPKKKSAIIVLGAGVENAQEYARKHTVSMQTLERLHYAAYLHNQTHLPIIVSGGKHDDHADSEAEIMQNTLEKAYKIKTIWLESSSKNTYEESQFLLPILKKHDIQTIYLVTHALHMPRSLYAFSKTFQDIEIIPAPMGYIHLTSKKLFSNFLPLPNALHMSFYALHEYLGLIWYRLRGMDKK